MDDGAKTTDPHTLDVLSAVQRFLDLIDEARAVDPQAWDWSLNEQDERQNDLFSQAFGVLEPFRRKPAAKS